MALTAPRRIPANLVTGLLVTLDHPVAADVILYKGAFGALNASGYLVPAASTAGLRACGIVNTGSDESLNTTGLAAGDKSLPVQAGIWPFANSSGVDQITQADVGHDCYMVDDQTVAKTDGSTGRGIAGQVVKIDGSLVFVAVGFRLIPGLPNEVLHAKSELVSAPGPISVLTRTTRLSVDGTDAYTLADGFFVGQRKTITVSAGANTPVGTITPAHPSGFATVTALGVVGDYVEFEWNGAAWELCHYAGVTIT